MSRLGIYASQISGHLTPPAVLAYDSIATQTVGSGGSSSVTFSSIPSTYKHLQIRGYVKASDDWLFSFNGSGGTNYTRHLLYGSGSGSTTASAYYDSVSAYIGYGSATAQWGSFVIDVLDYSDTSKFKTTRSFAGFDNNGSGFIMLNSSVWKNTSAISSITIAPQGTMAQYTQIALYGIKG